MTSISALPLHLPLRACASTALAIALLAGSGFASANGNLAQGASVTLVDPDGELGVGWGSNPAADPATLTDGLFLPEGHAWDSGTVFWTDWNQNSSFVAQITLNAPALVGHLVMQVDNNDGYLVRYQDVQGTWSTLVDPAVSCCWGVTTRDVTFAPVTASAFQVVAYGGDGYYSLSEFQAYGVSAVPEPASMALMGLGVAALSSLRSRQRRS